MITRTLLGSDFPHLIQVSPSDSRIGEGTDYGVGLTLDEVNLIRFCWKGWNILNTGVSPGGPLNDWWNTAVSGQALPTPNNLPNNNVWSLRALSAAGTFLYPWGNNSGDNITSAYWDSQKKYPLEVSFNDPGTGWDAYRTGVIGDNATQINTGISFDTVYFDGTYYYPAFFVYNGGNQTSTNLANLSGSPAYIGELYMFGPGSPGDRLSTKIYSNSFSYGPYDLTWEPVGRW